MGDVIHTLPALSDAKSILDDVEFDFVVEESFQEIPAWHPSVNKVIPVATRRWRKNLWSSKAQIKTGIRELRKQKYDVVIDAQGLIKSVLIARLAKGVRHGYDSHSIREPLASRFYQRSHQVSQSSHAIDRVRQLFAHSLGYEDKLKELDESLGYGISTSNISVQKADKEVLSQLREKSYMVLLHGTTWRSKEWPVSNWQQLAKELSRDYQVLIPWGNETELERAKTISQGDDKITVLPKLSLSALAHMLDDAEGVVAVDTGLGHLAAALSKPTISIYGPTDTELIGTIGENQHHLCATDEPNWRGMKKNEVFDYDKVSVQDVYAGLLSLCK